MALRPVVRSQMNFLTAQVFPLIAWSQLDAQTLEAQFNASLAELRGWPQMGQSDTQNPLLLYWKLLEHPARIRRIGHHLNMVLNAPEWKRFDASTSKQQILYEIEIHGDATLKRMIEEYVPRSEEEARYRKDILKQFRTHPAALLQKLSDLHIEFQGNVVEDISARKLEIACTDGCARGISEQLAERIVRDGMLTLDSSNIVQEEVLKRLDDEEVRRKYWEFLQKRCESNDKLIEQILAIKAEIAQFYEYSDACQMNLEDRMARNASKVDEFLNGLNSALLRQVEADYALLQEVFDVEMKPWSLPYYVEKYSKRALSYDEEEVRQYLPFEGVVPRFLAVIAQKYGVHFSENQAADTWHPDAKVYEIFKGQVRLGRLYLDLLQRRDKQPGAWFNRLDGETFVVVANFPPRSSPHQLRFSDLKTLFHEFGHAMHAILAEAAFEPLQNTMGCAWDFVEVPSMYNENFAYDPTVLQQIAISADGRPIPDELIGKIRAERALLASLSIRGQVRLSAMDLFLHRDNEWQKGVANESFSSIDSFLSNALKRYSHDFGFPVRTNVRSFLHLFNSLGGYTCGYYGYLWAGVIQSQLFERYADDMESYIEKVIKPGNSRPAAEIIEQAAGDIRVDAFLRQHGIDK